jgi:hypothetical protein
MVIWFFASNLNKSSFLSLHSPFFANLKDTLRQNSQFKEEKAECSCNTMHFKPKNSRINITARLPCILSGTINQVSLIIQLSTIN